MSHGRPPPLAARRMLVSPAAAMTAATRRFARVFGWVLVERGFASGTTEVVGLAFMLALDRLLLVHLHAADRVFRHCRSSSLLSRLSNWIVGPHGGGSRTIITQAECRLTVTYTANTANLQIDVAQTAAFTTV